MYVKKKQQLLKNYVQINCNLVFLWKIIQFSMAHRHHRYLFFHVQRYYFRFFFPFFLFLLLHDRFIFSLLVSLYSIVLCTLLIFVPICIIFSASSSLLLMLIPLLLIKLVMLYTFVVLNNGKFCCIPQFIVRILRKKRSHTQMAKNGNEN